MNDDDGGGRSSVDQNHDHVLIMQTISDKKITVMKDGYITFQDMIEDDPRRGRKLRHGKIELQAKVVVIKAPLMMMMALMMIFI